MPAHKEIPGRRKPPCPFGAELDWLLSLSGLHRRDIPKLTRVLQTELSAYCRGLKPPPLWALREIAEHLKFPTELDKQSFFLYAQFDKDEKDWIRVNQKAIRMLMSLSASISQNKGCGKLSSLLYRRSEKGNTNDLYRCRNKTAPSVVRNG